MGYHKIDQTDRKILNILQENAKITNAQLAKDIDLSPAPTLERVKKLENLGLIRSYHAKLDTKKLGLGVTTFIMVKLAKYNKKSNDEFVRKIRDIKEIIECHFVTGSSHCMLKVIASDIETYQNLIIEKLSAIDEIANMQTMVILSTVKDESVMPI
jgi:DNA-binding Lrp family transcriptional regulator